TSEDSAVYFCAREG
nr:immunoglobulin heavy chain junction region [Mus musculus]